MDTKNTRRPIPYKPNRKSAAGRTVHKWRGKDRKYDLPCACVIGVQRIAEQGNPNLLRDGRGNFGVCATEALRRLRHNDLEKFAFMLQQYGNGDLDHLRYLLQQRGQQGTRRNTKKSRPDDTKQFASYTEWYTNDENLKIERRRELAERLFNISLPRIVSLTKHKSMRSIYAACRDIL